MTRQRKHTKREEESRPTQPLPPQPQHPGHLIVLSEVPMLDSPEWSSDDELDNPTYNKRFRRQKHEAIRQRLQKKRQAEKERQQLERASGAHRRGSHRNAPRDGAAPASAAAAAAAEGTQPPPASSSGPHTTDSSAACALKRDQRTVAARAVAANPAGDVPPSMHPSHHPSPSASAQSTLMAQESAQTSPSVAQRPSSKNGSARDRATPHAAPVAHAVPPSAPPPVPPPPPPAASAAARRPPPLSPPQLQTPAVPAFSAVEVQLPKPRGAAARALARQSADGLSAVPIAPLPVFGGSAGAGPSDAEGAGSPTTSSMPTLSQTATPLAAPSGDTAPTAQVPRAVGLNPKPTAASTELSARDGRAAGEVVDAGCGTSAGSIATGSAAALSRAAHEKRSADVLDSAPASDTAVTVERSAGGHRQKRTAAANEAGSVRGGGDAAHVPSASHRSQPSNDTSGVWATQAKQHSPALPPAAPSAAAKTFTAATGLVLTSTPAATTTATANSGTAGTSPLPGAPLLLHRPALGVQLAGTPPPPPHGEGVAESLYDYTVFGSLAAAVLSGRTKGPAAPTAAAQCTAAPPSLTSSRPTRVSGSLTSAHLRRPVASPSPSSASSASASDDNTGTSTGQAHRPHHIHNAGGGAGDVDGAPGDPLSSDGPRTTTSGSGSGGTAMHSWLESSTATRLSSSSRFGADVLLAYHSSYYGDMMRHLDEAAASSSPTEPSGDDSLDVTRQFDSALKREAEGNRENRRTSSRGSTNSSSSSSSSNAAVGAADARGMGFAALPDRPHRATPPQPLGGTFEHAGHGTALERSPVLRSVASAVSRGRQRGPLVTVHEADRSRSTTDTLSSCTDDCNSPRSTRDDSPDVLRLLHRDILARRRRSVRQSGGYDSDETSHSHARRSLGEADPLYSWYRPLGSGKDLAPAARPGTAGTATTATAMTTVSTASSLQQAQSDGDDYSIGLGAVASATTAASSAASDGGAGGRASNAAAPQEAVTTPTASDALSPRAAGSGAASAPATRLHLLGHAMTSLAAPSTAAHEGEEEEAEDVLRAAWYLIPASTHVSSRLHTATASRGGASGVVSPVTPSSGRHHHHHHGRSASSPSSSSPPPYDIFSLPHDSQRHPPAAREAPAARAGGPPPPPAPVGALPHQREGREAAAATSSWRPPDPAPPPPLTPFQRPPSAPPQGRGRGAGVGGGTACLPLTIPSSSLPSSSTRLSKSSELRSPMYRNTTATPEALLITSVTSESVGAAAAVPATFSTLTPASSLAYQPPAHFLTHAQAPPPPPPPPPPTAATASHISASASLSSPPPPPAPPKAVPPSRSQAGTSIAGVSISEMYGRMSTAGTSSNRRTGLLTHSQASAGSDVLSFLDKAAAEDDARESRARRRRRQRERGRHGTASDHSGEGSGIVELLAASSTTAGGAVSTTNAVPPARLRVPATASSSCADVATAVSTMAATTATATRSSQSNSSSGPGPAAAAVRGRMLRPESPELSARSSVRSTDTYCGSAPPPPQPQPQPAVAAAVSQSAARAPLAEKGTSGRRAPPGTVGMPSEGHIAVPAPGARGVRGRAATTTSSSGASNGAAGEMANARAVPESAHLAEMHTSSRGLLRGRQPAAAHADDVDNGALSSDDSARTILVGFASRATQSFFVAPAAPSFLCSSRAEDREGASAAASLPRAPAEAPPSAIPPPPPPPPAMRRRRNTAPCSPPGARGALPAAAAASSVSTTSSGGPPGPPIRRTHVARRLCPLVGDRPVGDDSSASFEAASTAPVHVAASRLHHGFTSASSVDSSRDGAAMPYAPSASADGADQVMSGGSSRWGSAGGSLLVPPPRTGQSFLPIAAAPLSPSPAPSQRHLRGGGGGGGGGGGSGPSNAVAELQQQPSRHATTRPTATTTAAGVTSGGVPGAGERSPDAGAVTLALRVRGSAPPGPGAVQRSTDDFALFTDRRLGGRAGAAAGAGGGGRGGGALPFASTQRPPSASSSLAVWSTVGVAAERVTVPGGPDHTRPHAVDGSGSSGDGGAEDLVRMLSAQLETTARPHGAAGWRRAPPRALSPLPDAILLDVFVKGGDGSGADTRPPPPPPTVAAGRTGAFAPGPLATSAARSARQRILSAGSCDGDDGGAASPRVNAAPVVARLTAETLRRQQEQQQQPRWRAEAPPTTAAMTSATTATQGTTEDLLARVTVLRDESRWESAAPGSSLISLLNANVFAPRATASASANGHVVLPKRNGVLQSPPELQRSVEGTDNGDAYACGRPSGASPPPGSAFSQ